MSSVPPTPARPFAGNAVPPAANFLRAIVADDVRTQKYTGRVVTRFPPEPNGYLHFGHSKSIALNFGLAAEFGGVCHLRFDDTNPLKEDVEFEGSIADAVRWLGYDWDARFHASDYYADLYRFAEWFIGEGLAYVDSQSAQEMRATRGTLTEAGMASPFRARSVAENLDLFRRMRDGEFADGAHVLRLRIDMASPNVNLRDPTIYRIRYAWHHRTGDAWCIDPLYNYTHCISDALERITHSVCTLEFQDHRPLYDWIIDRLADGGQLERPLPHQYEFARLNLSYVVLSKRKLLELVEGGHVDGWDDPRMPTIVGARRRGYTPERFRLFNDRVGVSRIDSWIDIALLEAAMRDDLNARAERRVAVLDPVRLVIDNYPAGESEECLAPNHPQHPELGKRALAFGRELWIERDDYSENPPKGYFRLAPGAEVRLRYAYVIKCVGVEHDASGAVSTIHCTYDPQTRSGTPGADARKVKGNIHWLSATDAQPAEVRLYDRLFRVPYPGARNPHGDTAHATAAPHVAAAAGARRNVPPLPLVGEGWGEGRASIPTTNDADAAGADAAERNYLDDLNPGSKRVIRALIEPALATATRETHVQFERHGYFVSF